jgi:hypothetical protein
MTMMLSNRRLEKEVRTDTMNNGKVTEERTRREGMMTAKIDATGDGRYKRHNAYDAQADRDEARSTAKSNNKVVALAQIGARKRKSDQAVGREDKENDTPVEPTKLSIPTGRGKKRKPRNQKASKVTDILEPKETDGKSPNVSAKKKPTSPGLKVTKRVEREKTDMEKIASRKSGVTKASDTFGCRHLGVRQLHSMNVSWYKSFIREGEFLYGNNCKGETCNNLPAKNILSEHGKAKSDGTVLYYCDEGCKAVHSKDPIVLKDLKCDFFLCRPCYFSRIEKLECSTSSTTLGGRRRSGRVR